MPASVDVITVPDFTRAAAPRFELRTLLFLGAWMRHEGASRSWPVHLACIGDPPASVRRLADRAGASITVHPPMPQPIPKTCNKQRGFEITPACDRFLLLDTDTLVLRDLAPMADAVGSGIGVGPTTANHFPESVWRQVYQSVGVTYPGTTGTCWHAQWDLGAHKRINAAYREQCLHMPPYYNGGVVMGTWTHRLGDRWRACIPLILRLVPEQPPQIQPTFVRHIDQLTLATSTVSMAQMGVPVATLPLAFQVRPPLLRCGVVPWRDVALFHYAHLLRPYGESVDEINRLLYGRWWRPARRRLAVRTFGDFLEEVHQIVQAYVVNA